MQTLLLEETEAAITVSNEIISSEAVQLSRTLEKSIADLPIPHYLKLGEVTEKVNAKYDHLVKIVTEYAPYESKGSLSAKELTAELRMIKDSISADIASLMVNAAEQYEIFGEREIEVKNAFSKSLNLIDDALGIDHLFSVAEDSEQLSYELLLNKLTVSRHQTLLELYFFRKQPCFSFEMLWPIVLNGKCTYQKGETIALEVGAGSYHTYINQENTEILFDGKPLTIKYGTAIHHLDTSTPGENVIDIIMTTTHPITGEVNLSESSYVYTVHK